MVKKAKKMIKVAKSVKKVAKKTAKKTSTKKMTKSLKTRMCNTVITRTIYIIKTINYVVSQKRKALAKIARKVAVARKLTMKKVLKTKTSPKVMIKIMKARKAN